MTTTKVLPVEKSATENVRGRDNEREINPFDNELHWRPIIHRGYN